MQATALSMSLDNWLFGVLDRLIWRVQELFLLVGALIVKVDVLILVVKL